VVTGIAGQTRAQVTFEGQAGHAGTVPMDMRQDALAGAAEWVSAVEATARETPGLVATVGELTVEPGAGNVIPGRVVASLDVRQDPAPTVEALRRSAIAIADARGLGLAWEVRQETPAIACDPTLTDLLAEAAGGDLPRVSTGEPPVLEVPRLTSGAGHDAAMMARLAPVAMLFVRCAGGISHHPAESVTPEDVAAAIDATTRFLELLGRE